MKKVDAIIRPSMLEAVQKALERRGIGGLTVTEVAGAGHEPGHATTYRGAVYAVDTHARVRVEVVVADAEAVPIGDTIARAARTGRVGDGLVTITPIAEAVRIRTGERGVAAVASTAGGIEEESGRDRAALRAARGRGDGAPLAR
jgi:nitrogen regulatory protein P-II 1